MRFGLQWPPSGTRVGGTFNHSSQNQLSLGSWETAWSADLGVPNAAPLVSSAVAPAAERAPAAGGGMAVAWRSHGFGVAVCGQKSSPSVLTCS